MPITRRRRIVRLTAMALAVVGLLLSFYVSTYCGAYWLRGKRVVSHDQLKTLNVTVFRPLEIYGLDRWPGGHSLRVLVQWCMLHGNGTPFTWKEADDWVTGNEEYEPPDQMLSIRFMNLESAGTPAAGSLDESSQE